MVLPEFLLILPLLARWSLVTGKKYKCFDEENIHHAWTNKGLSDWHPSVWVKHIGERCEEKAELAGQQPQGILKTWDDSRAVSRRLSEVISGGFGTFFWSDWPKFFSWLRFMYQGSVNVRRYVTRLDTRLTSTHLFFFIKASHFYLLNLVLLFLCTP